MMDSEEFLREEEEMALGGGFYHPSEARELEENSSFVTNVQGKNAKGKMKGLGKIKVFGATGLITALIVVFGVIVASGNMIPDAISQRLIEETDAQYADAVQSKAIVFQQALRDGDVPDDTAAILKEKGVTVGYMDGGEFVENNKSGVSTVLKTKNGIVTADEFANKVNTDVELYNAFNEATYSRAAYYYDESATAVFKKIGTTRDNYTSSSDFDEVMNELVGSGSNIDVNTVALVEKTQQNENGETETYYEYEETGANANSGAVGFIDAVGSKNSAATVAEATLNSADALKVADTVAKEQRSSLFYLTFMENISKMKAGEGNEAKVNDAMNYLYQKVESEVVDVKTGQVVKTVGTALESPSLYAVLSGNKVETESVENYSSDRILKLAENQTGVSGETAIKGTVASSTSKVKGSVGRLLTSGAAGASNEILSMAEPTVSSSLVNNSYETIKGVNAGEFLVEGAVNVGKELAKQSGASPGDATAATAYAKLNSQVLAMDAAVDRINRSPFDITSKNTFLGSIIYKMAIFGSKASGVFAGIKTFAKATGTAVLSLLPGAYADETEGYLSTFGGCETYGTIGAVGTAQCSEVATFDVTTLDDPFNNAEFVKYLEENTTLENGVRKINKGSSLERLVLYNNSRITPIGTKDGGIIDSIENESSSISFVSSILKIIKLLLGTPEWENRIASGASFVNSSSNADWDSYKWGQRYVSLARAESALRQYSDDATAYRSMKYFEGEENPVVALLREHYAVAEE